MRGKSDILIIPKNLNSPNQMSTGLPHTQRSVLLARCQGQAAIGQGDNAEISAEDATQGKTPIHARATRRAADRTQFIPLQIGQQ